VKFMYTGTLEFADVSAALHVIAVADYLMMDSVKSVSAEYLMAEMNPTNALEMVKEVALYSQDVADKASNYVDIHFSDISDSTSDWCTLTPGEIQYWLGRDTLLVQSEDMVFDALQCWTAYDAKARTKVFKSLMLDGTIRMFYISNEKLAKIRAHAFSKSITKDLDAEAWRRMAAGGFEAACVGLDVSPRCHSVPREPVCPLTKEPFLDAVVLPCGHRFDKHALNNHKKVCQTSRKKSCPMFGCRGAFTKMPTVDLTFQTQCDALRNKHVMAGSKFTTDDGGGGTPANKRMSADLEEWRKDHPPGFFINVLAPLKWEAGIPGKQGTPWEGGVYKVTMDFTENFPSQPLLIKFTPTLFHPNLYPSGRVSMDVLE